MNVSAMSPVDQNVPVLIVGGGLVGLSAAASLAWHGVHAVLVERRPASSPHPRAVGFTTRTLEMYRAIGLSTDIPQLAMGSGRPRRVSVESLTGKWSDEISWSAGKPPVDNPDDPPRPKIGYSPVTGAAIAQDRLEPLVRQHAIKLGADIRLNTTLMNFEQDSAGVTATLRNADGQEYALRAEYMVAADGHASRIREELGIERSGHGFMHVVRSVLFYAPEMLHYLESGISQFELALPDIQGMLTTYGDGRWLLMITDDEERDEAGQLEMVHKALGRSDVEVELITSGRWVLSALIADSFQKGRVFLAGDAAHALPPARGGYGANTGIEDAFNLSWKLAAVISGDSSPALLESYAPERSAIAWLRHNQIFARPDYASVATDDEKKVAVLEDDAMELGQLYRSEIIIGANDDLPPAQRPEQWAGQPGSRAHHLWVSKDGKRLSTIDLLQHHWTLVTAEDRWCAAAGKASVQLGINVEVLYFGDAAPSDATIISPAADQAVSLTLDLPIEQIANEPAGKAALDLHIPQLTAHDAYPTFKSMTLRQLMPMSEGLITDDKLHRIERDISDVRSTAISADSGVFQKEFQIAFGIGPAGASLVRPDGYVAWRSAGLSDDPAGTLISALRQAASTTR
jgi:2-polyprenyl-6-methoxyphenol hydroxylase-like FAD-dependent oxidoreductase